MKAGSNYDVYGSRDGWASLAFSTCPNFVMVVIAEADPKVHWLHTEFLAVRFCKSFPGQANPLLSILSSSIPPPNRARDPYYMKAGSNYNRYDSGGRSASSRVLSVPFVPNAPGYKTKRCLFHLSEFHDGGNPLIRVKATTEQGGWPDPSIAPAPKP
ncbi:hypothetical protein BD779DRAFT_478694 [Infundibulicybe gibba]|nr:hypothetical protein BD779DRAFT_478694 [Infundibulicybe gibba]